MDEAVQIPARVTALGELKAITPAQYDELERWMFTLPQLELPVTHQFAAGLYIREGKLPADSLVLGHEHKEPHHCVILKGRMTLLTPDGQTQEIVAPCAFIGQPGRKLVFVHEEVVGQNIHSTADWPAACHGDIEAMEEHLYNRSAFFKQQQLAKAAVNAIAA